MKKFFLIFTFIFLFTNTSIAKDIFDDKRFQKLCGQAQKEGGQCLCFKGAKGNTGSKHWNGEVVLTEKGFNCPKGNWGLAWKSNKDFKWSSHRGTGEMTPESEYGKYGQFKSTHEGGQFHLEKNAEFQKFCNVSADESTATGMFCGCAGQFKDFSKAYSEEELIENPDIVSKPTSLSHQYVEFADAYKNSKGMWTCPASFFGIIANKGKYYDILGRSEDIGKKVNNVKSSKSTQQSKKTNTNKSVKEKLLDLKNLFDEGLITKEVYEKKQLEILEE